MRIAPPLSPVETLLANVQFAMVAGVELIWIAPPPAEAWLPLSMQFTNVVLLAAKTNTAPPEPEEFPTNVQFAKVVTVACVRIAPPELNALLSAKTHPCAISVLFSP